mgnify:CR=1 FL=1
MYPQDGGGRLPREVPVRGVQRRLGRKPGILGAPITGVFPQMGDNLILLSLIVVVVGGTGYIQGTMLGALVIGLLDTFGKAYVPKMAMFFGSAIFRAPFQAATLSSSAAGEGDSGGRR